MRLLVLDTETTGLTSNDRVIELAWLEVDGSLEVINSTHSLIDPQMPIDPEASKINNIYDKDVEFAPTLREFFGIVRKEEFRQDLYVVQIGHNVPFDYKFIKSEMPVKDQICTLRLAQYFYPDAPNHKLETLREYFNLQVVGRSHGALVDCFVTLEFLKFLMKDKGLSLHDVLELTRKPLLLSVMPFGKHKGKPFSAVPSYYLRWCCEQADMSRDVLHTIRNMR